VSRRTRILVVGAFLALGAGDPVAQPSTLKLAMRTKLVNTQGLLEGIVKADFAAITRYTEPLERITDTEIASWQEVARPEYTKEAIRFLLSVEGLRNAAAARDIEAVGMEYGTLVSSCIRCHAYVRRAPRPSQP
jgi:hypothetical protein